MTEGIVLVLIKENFMMMKIGLLIFCHAFVSSLELKIKELKLGYIIISIAGVLFVPKRLGVEYVDTCMQELFIMY